LGKRQLRKKTTTLPVVAAPFVDHFLMELGINYDPRDLIGPTFNGTLTIKEAFLALLSSRERTLILRNDEIRYWFNKYDRRNLGMVGKKEASKVLVGLGVSPRNKGEQEEIEYLMTNADADGNGDYAMEEFRLLFVKVIERVQASQFRSELDLGRDRCSTNDIVKLRRVFYRLDANCSGALDLQEVPHAVQLACKTRELLTQADKDEERKERETIGALVRTRISESDAGKRGWFDFIDFLELIDKVTQDVDGRDIKNVQCVGGELILN